MTLEALEASIRTHAGEFDCVAIREERLTRQVAFAHLVTAAEHPRDLPDVGRLREFYATFGGIEFYRDPVSGDAARRIAPPSEWEALRGEFQGWMDIVDGEDEDDLDEMMPGGIASCLVIGETPHSGNYILMATRGLGAGTVVEFDHDGFEFTVEAADLVEYAGKLLVPDERRLTDFASHLRFSTTDDAQQWWIREMRDNRGRVVRTRD